MVGRVSARSVILGAAFTLHELLLHSQANVLLEQGGLFGQDRVQELLLLPESRHQRLIPTLTTMLYDRLGRSIAISMLDSLTSRHDERVANALLERMKPNTFRMLLTNFDEAKPGLTDGIRVILNMAAVRNQQIQSKFIETLIKTGSTDRLVKEILIPVQKRSGQDLKQWMMKNPQETIQFIRERELAIKTLSFLLSSPQFVKMLLSDFDSCFANPSEIRKLISPTNADPAVSLISRLQSAAVGATGKKSAQKARLLLSQAMEKSDPRLPILQNSVKPEKTKSVHGILSFVMPQYEDGKQITIERMKLSSSLGVVTSTVALILGRRAGPLVRTALKSGLGASLFVLWNDMFINWDRFFFRERFPVFDRSSETGRYNDAAWSFASAIVHFAGNFALSSLFPGSFLPYLLISISHFSGELYFLSRMVGLAPPPHTPRILPKPGASGEI